MPSLVRDAAPILRNSQPLLPTMPGYALASRIMTSHYFELFAARAASQPGDCMCDYLIKRVRESLADHELPRALLAREVLIAGEFAQPNLISVLDADLNAACPFVVLPLLQGRTIEQLCQSPLPTAAPQALWYARQMAAALAELHAAGWLHCQVSPRHVILSDQGHATLIDLGAARRVDNTECRTDRWITGEPAHLAPEAFQPNQRLTAAADVYSLGLLLFKLLQGTKANNAEPQADARRAITNLRAIRPDVSREIAILLTKMLAKEPIRRPTANELVETLSRLEIESLMQW